MLLKTYSGLPRPVYVLFATRIINRLGDFVRVFLALYLTRYLGYDESRAGLIVTVSALATLAGNLTGGKAGDHLPRKASMLFGHTITALTIGICGWIPDHPVVPVILVISQFFFGFVRPINGAMVIDLTPAAQRQRAHSLLYLGINIGVALGPLLAGFLFNEHRRWIFWGDSLTSCIAILLVLFFVPEPKNPEISESHNEQAEGGNSLSALVKRPDLAIFMLLSIFYSIVYSQHSFGVPLQLDSLFGIQGAQLFGYFMSFNALIVLIFTPLMLKLLEKRPAFSNYRLGALFNALGLSLLFLNRPWFPLFLFADFVFTIGEIIAVTNEGIFVASLTPVNHRGRFNALRNASRTLGISISPVFGGVILTQLGFTFFWIIIGMVGVLQVAGLFLLSRRMERRLST